MIKKIKALMNKRIGGATIKGWMIAFLLCPIALTGAIVGLVIIPFYRGFQSAGDWLDTLD